MTRSSHLLRVSSTARNRPSWRQVSTISGFSSTGRRTSSGAPQSSRATSGSFLRGRASGRCSVGITTLKRSIASPGRAEVSKSAGDATSCANTRHFSGCQPARIGFRLRFLGLKSSAAASPQSQPTAKGGRYRQVFNTRSSPNCSRFGNKLPRCCCSYPRPYCHCLSYLVIKQMPVAKGFHEYWLARFWVWEDKRRVGPQGLGSCSGRGLRSRLLTVYRPGFRPRVHVIRRRCNG